MQRGTGLLVGAAIIGGVWVGARRSLRVAVAGGSMRPALAPGDYVIATALPRWTVFGRLAARAGQPRPGWLVVCRRPDQPTLTLIKRVERVEADGSVWVRGDAASASTDSRQFGPVAAADVLGVAWWRYWPLDRFGPLRGRTGGGRAAAGGVRPSERNGVRR